MTEQSSSDQKPQNEPSVVSASTEPKIPEVVSGKKPGKKGLAIKIIIAVALFLVVGIVAAVSIAMYRLPPTDPLVRAVGSRLPYPVASVNGDWIPFSEYFKEYDAMAKYVAESGETTLSDAEMTSEVLNTLVNEAVVGQLADRYNVKVSEDKVEEFLQSAYAQSESKESFYAEVEQMFGWDEKTFTERIIRPLVLASQLEEAIQADATVQTEARSAIDGALARLDAGEAFSDVATDVGDAYTSESGGDIGYVNTDPSYGELPEEWYGEIESLEIGAYSGVVESADAFAIIQLRDRIAGTEGESDQAQLSIVLVMKRTVDDIIQDFKDESKIKRFIGEEE